MSRRLLYLVLSLSTILLVAGCAYSLTQINGDASASSARPRTGTHTSSPPYKNGKGTTVVSTSTPGGSGTPPSSSNATENQIAQAVFAAINKDRTAAGLPALQWSAALASGAHLHNQRMAAANQLAHQLSGEPDLGTRITQDGIKWWWAGENIGMTSDATTHGALGLC